MLKGAKFIWKITNMLFRRVNAKAGEEAFSLRKTPLSHQAETSRSFVNFHLTVSFIVSGSFHVLLLLFLCFGSRMKSN